jgi:hypothetical protein
MKGKLYKYDGKTKKMVELSDANLMPLGEFEADNGAKIEFGLMAIPTSESVMSEQKRDNLKRVFRKADEYAEKMDRRDCLRVQEKIAWMREKYGIDE